MILKLFFIATIYFLKELNEIIQADHSAQLWIPQASTN